MKNDRLILVIILVFVIFFGLMMRDVDLPEMKVVKQMDGETKIGVVSDTHIPTRAEAIPEQVLDRFREEEVGLIIHAGDMVTMEVKNSLEEIAPVVAVAGNMDRTEVRNHYPEAAVLEAGGKRIGVIHNTVNPLSDKMKLLAEENRLDLLVFGHTHRQQLEEKDGIYYLNPGSPSQPIMSEAGFALIEVKESGLEPKLIKIEK